MSQNCVHKRRQVLTTFYIHRKYNSALPLKVNVRKHTTVKWLENLRFDMH